MQEQDHSRLSQLRHTGFFPTVRRWATDKVKGLTPKNKDQTTRGAVSEPSSPTSARTRRLRSTSLDNAAVISNKPEMAANEKEDNQMQSASHQSDQERQLPRIVINSDFDCSAAKTRAGTNYLSRAPLRVLQPGHDVHSNEQLPTEHQSQTSSFNASEQGKENRLQHLEREPSPSRSQQHTYVHPLNGNYPPAGSSQQQGPGVLDTNGTGENRCVQFYNEDGIRVTRQCDPILEPQGRIVQNQPSSSGVEKSQELKALHEQVKQLVKDINYMNDHMMDKTDWLKNYEEYILPYEERMRVLVLKLAGADVFGDLLKWTCQQDEALGSLKAFYRNKAQEMISEFTCTSVRETPDVEVIEEVLHYPTPSTRELPEGQRGGVEEGQEARIPFSIWEDDDLEQSLSKTRCITNMSSGIEDARSKANFAQESVKDLIKRMETLENQMHKCDPNIYRRLATLEAGTKIMQQSSAAKKDVIEIQKEFNEFKHNRRHVNEVINKTEARFSGLKGKIDLVHNLVKNLCSSMGQDFNVLSSTSHPDPDWG